MASAKATTWVNYVEQINTGKNNLELSKIEGVEKLLNVQSNHFNILNHSVPLVYLLDYTTGRYLYVSRQCQVHLNISPEKMMTNAISFVMERYHPEDLELFNEQIFTDRLKLLESIPVDQHKDHVFSFNFRLKNGNGEFVNILQRNSFIKSEENGKPLVSLGTLTNINHFKTENPVIQLVEKIDPLTGQVDTISKITYYLKEEDKIFSKREKEVLLHIAEGLTSKQIADKLFISEHTVINHKRNMHHKSNTQNTAALINFAFRQHLL
ncbi:LuxR C-terminal-related transcriptional regulator [soil metagenome]